MRILMMGVCSLCVLSFSTMVSAGNIEKANKSASIYASNNGVKNLQGGVSYVGIVDSKVIFSNKPIKIKIDRTYRPNSFADLGVIINANQTIEKASYHQQFFNII
jgi:hypothetical protein